MGEDYKETIGAQLEFCMGGGGRYLEELACCRTLAVSMLASMTDCRLPVITSVPCYLGLISYSHKGENPHNIYLS